MTAKVTIKSKFIKEAWQIPLTAVFRKEGKPYCLSGSEESGLIIRPIKLGSHNMTMAVVEDGLEPGEPVVLNPDSFRAKLENPKSLGLAIK